MYVIAITIVFLCMTCMDLNFIRYISSHGKERVKFNQPFDVKFDTAGNMYVADLSNNRVQVMNSSGQFI